jgi:putative membrane protein
MDTAISSSGGAAENPGSHAAILEHQKATEYLASERTFLAWIRTSIAILSLGFLIAKFGVWLRELSEQLSHKPSQSFGISLPIGITMMALAGILALLALWHYHVVNRAIQKGRVRANRTLVTAVAIIMAVFSVVVILYLLATTRIPIPM